MSNVTPANTVTVGARTHDKGQVRCVHLCLFKIMLHIFADSHVMYETAAPVELHICLDLDLS